MRPRSIFGPLFGTRRENDELLYLLLASHALVDLWHASLARKRMVAWNLEVLGRLFQTILLRELQTERGFIGCRHSQIFSDEMVVRRIE